MLVMKISNYRLHVCVSVSVSKGSTTQRNQVRNIKFREIKGKYFCRLLAGMKSVVLTPILLAFLWGMDRNLATTPGEKDEITREREKGKDKF